MRLSVSSFACSPLLTPSTNFQSELDRLLGALNLDWQMSLQYIRFFSSVDG
jgi:hypothetical protein